MSYYPDRCPECRDYVRDCVCEESAPVEPRPERLALVTGHGITAERVAAYLPRGYRVAESDVTGSRGDSVIIAGVDYAGWTMADYVAPRLASGGLYATEILTPLVENLPCVSCETAPATHRTPDLYPICDGCDVVESAQTDPNPNSTKG